MMLVSKVDILLGLDQHVSGTGFKINSQNWKSD